MDSRRRPQHGFTLVELLVVIAIFGIFIGAVYSLYITHLKTAIAREAVVDVQQNVRIAMDRLTRDVRTAGFLVIPGLEKAMSNYSTVSIQNASSEGTFVSITGVLSTTNYNRFSVTPTNVLSSITPGVNTVIIIRPSTKAQVGGSVFSVLSSSVATGRMSVSPALTTPNIPLIGDVVCKAATYPEYIRYRIDRTTASQGCTTSACLTRNGEIIAQGIEHIGFEYYLGGDNSTSVANSDLTSVDVSTLSAIRVAVTGQTKDSKFKIYSSSGKRILRSFVKLRNFK